MDSFHHGAVRVVAAGKAAVGMTEAVRAVLGDRAIAGGLMTAAVDPAGLPRPWQAIAGGHPMPDAESERAGRAALALADATARESGLLLVLLSGGASAMLVVPREGLTLADKSAATHVMLRAGLDIGETNMVRRHLSAIKGGRLARRAHRTITLAISDVCTPIEDDPAVIGSGPTVPDQSTSADALDVIDRHHLRDALPPAVMAVLERARREEGAAASAAGDAAPHALQSDAYWIIASRQDAMRGAAAVARRLGYHVIVHQPPVVGEARDAATPLLEALARAPRPACLIASGETIVHVRGSGRGGRNQEVALGAWPTLAALAPAALLAIGTDGRDGPTDAAGAYVDAAAWRDLGPDAAARCTAALNQNDAYPLLDAAGALLRTGPTGTNVGDLVIAVTE